LRANQCDGGSSLGTGNPVSRARSHFSSRNGSHVAAHPADDSVNTTRRSGWRGRIAPVKLSAAIISPNPNDTACGAYGIDVPCTWFCAT
jgi:hypothetical protein